MKKIFVLLTIFALTTVLVGPVSADSEKGKGKQYAAQRPAPTAGRDLTPSACGRGRLVVNVHQKIVNDADEGSAGNVWALKSYERHIQVWRVITDTATVSDTYCALIKDAGRFVTLEGTSPGGADTVDGGIRGTFAGGYRTVQFIGSLNDDPIWRVRGNLGTIDYQCDEDGNCPGETTDWLNVYFSAPESVEEDWYGWRFHAGRRGTWTTSNAGNTGDIN